MNRMKEIIVKINKEKMIKYNDASAEMLLAWREAFCLEMCEYSPCKEYGGCDEEGCFEFHQEYYLDEFRETMLEVEIERKGKQ